MNNTSDSNFSNSNLPTVRINDAFRHGFFFAFGAAVLAILLFAGWKLLDATLAVAAPFIGAIVLSLLLEPLVRWVQSLATHGNRMSAVILVFVVFLSLFVALFSFAGPALIEQSQRLIRFFTPVTYTVTRSTGEKDRFVTVVDGIADNSATINNLVNGATYQFIVYSVNADGERFPSPVVAAMPRAESDKSDNDAPASEVAHSDKNSPLTEVSLPAQSPRSLKARPGDGVVRLMWQPSQIGQSGFDTLRGSIDKWLSGHPKIGPIALPKNLDAITAQYSDQASQALKLSASRLTTLIASSLGGVVTAILIPIISIFVLADIDRLRARAYLFLPEGGRRFAQTLVSDIGEVFGRYLRGLFIICSMYGGTCLVYLMVLSYWYPGLRGYALLLGALAGLLYSVPYLGAISTVGLCAIAALSTGGGVWGAVWAAGGVLALNQIFDYVVMPKVVGETSGIHPLLAMFALFLGGHLFGLWGMLIAVPIAASVQGVLFRLFPHLAAPTPLALIMGERRSTESDAPREKPGTPQPEG